LKNEENKVLNGKEREVSKEGRKRRKRRGGERNDV
jgi:hypothetical protein